MAIYTAINSFMRYWDMVSGVLGVRIPPSPPTKEPCTHAFCVQGFFVACGEERDSNDE